MSANKRTLLVAGSILIIAALFCAAIIVYGQSNGLTQRCHEYAIDGANQMLNARDLNRQMENLPPTDAAQNKEDFDGYYRDMYEFCLTSPDSPIK